MILRRPAGAQWILQLLTVLSPGDFARISQSAQSVVEVGEKTGLDLASLRQRAANYRKKGVPLQRFPGGRFPKADWATLAALAEELAPK